MATILTVTNLKCEATNKVTFNFFLLPGVGFTWRICALRVYLNRQVNVYKLTHKHAAHLQVEALPLQTSTCRTPSIGQVDGKTRVPHNGHLPEAKHKKKQKNFCSGSAGRSHCELVIEMAV